MIENILLRTEKKESEKNHMTQENETLPYQPKSDCNNMELSQENLENIQLAGDTAHIPDNLFKLFITRVVESILITENRHNHLC